MHDVNERLTPDGVKESAFRRQVRDLLDLDGSARDERILAEVRRLRDVEMRVNELEAAIQLSR